jgi:hypothetical protein
VEFEAQKLRGRTLDEAKLNRWMKLENATFEESLAKNDKAACVSSKFHFYSDLVYPTNICCEASVIPFKQNFGLANEDLGKQSPIQTSNHEEQNELDQQAQESQSVTVRYNDCSFDWNLVDVIGSPGLTKLIGVLTIEECDIPLLDLASDSLGTDNILESDLMDLCGRRDPAWEGNIISGIQSRSTTLSTLVKASQTFGNFGVLSHFNLRSELYPFPTSSS